MWRVCVFAALESIAVLDFVSELHTRQENKRVPGHRMIVTWNCVAVRRVGRGEGQGEEL